MLMRKEVKFIGLRILALYRKNGKSIILEDLQLCIECKLVILLKRKNGKLLAFQSLKGLMIYIQLFQSSYLGNQKMFIMLKNGINNLLTIVILGLYMKFVKTNTTKFSI